MKKSLIIIILFLPALLFAQDFTWTMMEPLPALVECTTPANDDMLLIEDAITGARKYIKYSNLPGASGGEINVQADWGETDTGDDAYILNKPTLFTPTTLFADYIFTDNSTNWNTAYGWGNHSAAGYLTGYSETDPTVNNSTITLSGTAVVSSPQSFSLNQPSGKTITINAAGVSFGSQYQLPYVNIGGTDFDYSSSFYYASGKLYVNGIETVGSIDAGFLNSDAYVRVEDSNPGTPSTGGLYYTKSDGLPYFKNDAGTEMSLFGGSGSAQDLESVLTEGNTSTLGAEFGGTVSGSNPVFDDDYTTKNWTETSYVKGSLTSGYYAAANGSKSIGNGKLLNSAGTYLDVIGAQGSIRIFTSAYLPTGTTMPASNYVSGLTFRHNISQNYENQLAFNTSGSMYMRSFINSATAGPWYKFYHEGNSIWTISGSDIYRNGEVWIGSTAQLTALTKYLLQVDGSIWVENSSAPSVYLKDTGTSGGQGGMVNDAGSLSFEYDGGTFMEHSGIDDIFYFNVPQRDQIINEPTTSASYTEYWNEGDIINISLTANTTVSIRNIPEGQESQVRIQQTTGGDSFTLNLYSGDGTGNLTKTTFGANSGISTVAGEVTKIYYQRFGTEADVQFIHEN